MAQAVGIVEPGVGAEAGRNDFLPHRGKALRIVECGNQSRIAQMLGPYGQLLKGSPHAAKGGVFAHNLLGAFQSYINHGGVQIMRDQVARRGLGLPKGPTEPKGAKA